jgi:hypothetical protein
MLFRKQNAGMRGTKNMNPVIFLPLVIAVILSLSACTAAKGGIVILENPNGTGFTMDFKEWSADNKCGLALRRGDVLRIETARESGEISLTVSGKTGSEACRLAEIAPQDDHPHMGRVRRVQFPAHLH